MASWAQSNKFANSAFRFATRAEAQMLITELDDYTRNWNQFDIDVRLQKPQGRKSELLQFAMDQTLNWSDKDKERISKAMKTLDAEIKKQKYNLNFPKEIIFVKTTQKEEGSAQAYTRMNWIAIGEEALLNNSDEDLQYLVAHELFHLLTRQNADFKKTCTSLSGSPSSRKKSCSRPTWQRNVSLIRISAAMTATELSPSAERNNTAPW